MEFGLARLGGIFIIGKHYTFTCKYKIIIKTQLGRFVIYFFFEWNKNLLFFFSSFSASADVGFAIYDRYAVEQQGPPVSYVAHLTGALAGLTIGLLVLKNFEQKLHEQVLWWVALGVYAACTLFAVLFNIFNYWYTWYILYIT